MDHVLRVSQTLFNVRNSFEPEILSFCLLFADCKPCEVAELLDMNQDKNSVLCHLLHNV
jgi:hypothetical protein